MNVSARLLCAKQINSNFPRGAPMKSLRAFVPMALLTLATLAGAQTWTPLTHQPTFGAGTALLLTDGTVMVQDAAFTNPNHWWRLKPDSSGSYVNGTWTQLASLPSGYDPLYYASAVLPDGRLVIVGGEYNLAARSKLTWLPSTIRRAMRGPAFPAHGPRWAMRRAPCCRTEHSCWATAATTSRRC